MNKVPHIERDVVSGGLTFDSARLWYAFLSEEAFWQDDMTTAQDYKSRSEGLLEGLRGGLHNNALEEAINQWKR
jgi:hypothetical protein